MATAVESAATDGGDPFGLAIAHHAAGHPHQATRHAQAAGTATIRAGHCLLEADAYRALAGIYAGQGLGERATAYAEQARAIHREAGHHLAQDPPPGPDEGSSGRAPPAAV